MFASDAREKTREVNELKPLQEYVKLEEYINNGCERGKTYAIREDRISRSIFIFYQENIDKLKLRGFEVHPEYISMNIGLWFWQTTSVRLNHQYTITWGE